MTQRRRPGPVQWLGYCFGRTLPDSMQGWVRNDLLGEHAFARHLIRGMVPFLPIFAAFFLFPGPLWLNCAMTLLGVILALFYCVSYMAPNRARRLEQHGLPPDLEDAKTAREHDAEQAEYERDHPHTQTATNR